jgi:hypothetical protein
MKVYVRKVRRKNEWVVKKKDKKNGKLTITLMSTHDNPVDAGHSMKQLYDKLKADNEDPDTEIEM